MITNFRKGNIKMSYKTKRVTTLNYNHLHIANKINRIIKEENENLDKNLILDSIRITGDDKDFVGSRKGDILLSLTGLNELVDEDAVYVDSETRIGSRGTFVKNTNMNLTTVIDGILEGQDVDISEENLNRIYKEKYIYFLIVFK